MSFNEHSFACQLASQYFLAVQKGQCDLEPDAYFEEHFNTKIEDIEKTRTFFNEKLTEILYAQFHMKIMENAFV